MNNIFAQIKATYPTIADDEINLYIDICNECNIEPSVADFESEF